MQISRAEKDETCVPGVCAYFASLFCFVFFFSNVLRAKYEEYRENKTSEAEKKTISQVNAPLVDTLTLRVQCLSVLSRVSLRNVMDG